MAVKGTSLVTTSKYVKSKYLDSYDEWILALPEASRKYFSDLIFATNWYPMQEGLIIPTKVLGDVVFNGDAETASFELGKNSAEHSLTGIYKIFIKIAKPEFILKKAGVIFSTYYSDTKFEVVDSDNRFAKFKIRGFNVEEKLIFYRIEGWISELFNLIKIDSLKIKTKIEEKDSEIIAYMVVRW